MVRIFLSLLSAFAITAVVMPLVIKLSLRLKVRQPILHYVDNHQSKSGTPTMGGVGFLLAVAAASLIFMRGDHSLMIIALLVTVGYGIIGFLDDFIKIRFKHNKGLSPWQKIVFQVLIAVIVSIFAYKNVHIGDGIFIPFLFREIHFGWLAVPFFIVVFLAFTNSVNLTDGLDGLASNVTIVYTLFFGVIVFCMTYFFEGGQAFDSEHMNILVFCGALVGGLLGFICYNGFPAKIFMGDTGALALGGGLACLAVITKLSLNILLIGIMYIVTSVSVILQVGYFKLTRGKRIFIMAPLHHHFERKGVHESKIVTVYTVITFLMGIVSVLLILLLN